ncbi:MAG: plasmid maintenance system killer [bacterium]|nr:plasmid maintenance system killer [bacterium]
MVKSFKHRGLRELFETGRSGRVNPDLHRRALRRLSALNVAAKPNDLALPGHHFHELKGQRQGTYAVAVNGPWRITFEWDEGPTNVDLEQYH